MKLKQVYISLLNEGKKYDINEIDIRYLLCFHQGYMNINSFYLKLDEEVNNINKIKEDFSKLKKGFPIAYIIGETDFLGNRYYVDKSTLIPRVETEELVGLAIKRIENFLKNKELKILDVGTGSGVIAIELSKRYKESKITATDISSDAIKIAKLNSKKYNAPIVFYKCDTFPNNDEKYNVIISNPPYIKFKKDCDKNVIKYEPNDALFISKDNDVYEKILSKIKEKCIFPCLIIFEIAPNLEKHLNSLLNKYLLDYQFSFNYSLDINKKVRFLTLLING